MPAKQDNINRMQVPVDIAARIFGETQDAVLNTIRGPQPRRPNTPPSEEAVIISAQGDVEDMIVPMTRHGS
jgi:hypothetical protein|tara:strand:+ start:398 stop:610 length:213 start_codon:yes stop_codon:yes gene_type:complete